MGPELPCWTPTAAAAGPQPAPGKALAHAVDTEGLPEHPAYLRPKRVITQSPSRPPDCLNPLGCMSMIGGWGDRRPQQIGSTPYTSRSASMNGTITSLVGRASPSQKYALALRRIPLACRNSRSSAPAPSSRRQHRSASRRGTTVNLGPLHPLVQRLAGKSHLRRVRDHRRPARQVIFVVVQHPAHRTHSHIRRNVFVVLFVIDPSSQGLVSSTNTAPST